MKLNFKSILTPALILCLICLVVSSLLALTNNLTKDKIAQAQLEAEEKSRLIVLPEAESFELSENGEYNIGLKGEEIIGYVFLTESKGYSSTVKVMTGIDTNSQITGVTIVSQSETPGLGSNATNKSFTDQYTQSAVNFEVVKNATENDGEITALTGATITSTAVTNAVNDAVEIYQTIGEGK